MTVASVAFAVTLLLIPLVKRAAHHFRLLDVPDGRRKLHSRVTPLGGGLAILGGLLVALMTALVLDTPFRAAILRSGAANAGTLVGACLLVAVGLMDDRFTLRGRQKLAGQVLAGLCLVSCGLTIRSVQFFAWNLDLGLLSVPITLFWFVGAINAFNLLDGIDGLASSVGLILSLAMAVMAWYLGHHVEALIALALAGSLLAFLFFNFPPASIFLGDAGSMLIGLLLGVLAIRSSLKGPATVALVAPLAILAIPILDTGMAILRRRLTGRSIYETDRGHLHHCLMKHGFSGRTTLLWIVSLCVITAAGALLGVVQQSDALAFGTVVLVVCTLAVTGMFGLSECQLLGQRVKNFATSLISRPGAWSAQSIPRGTQLHGDQEWDELWQMLVDYAQRFDLTSVWLNVNVPAVHEEYHAHWQRRGGDEWQLWQIQVPLVHQGVTIGKLGLAGRAGADSQFAWMSELIEGLTPFQALLTDLVDQLLATPEQPAELPGEAPSPQPTSPVSVAAS